MTNFEKYREEILKITKNGAHFAVPKKAQVPIACTCLSCVDCLFNGCCHPKKIRWLYEEAVEPAPTLTVKERAFCEIVQSGYIARDRDESLWVFSESPYEHDGIWTFEDENAYLINITREVFKFIDYKSRKVWSIEELLQLEVEE